MIETHEKAYAEIKYLYDELQTYLDSIIMTPEQEHICLKCEKLGDKIVEYNISIITNNSRLSQSNNEALSSLLEEVSLARATIKNDINKLKSVAKAASAIDKVLEKLVGVV